MSIIIPGMKLPPKGTRLFVAVNWCGDVYLITSGAEIITKYQPSAKAVELPPHGRLGDLDALRRAMYHEAFETDSPMQKWDSGCWIRYKLFERMEEAADTIIPAEEGEI